MGLVSAAVAQDPSGVGNRSGSRARPPAYDGAGDGDSGAVLARASRARSLGAAALGLPASGRPDGHPTSPGRLLLAAGVGDAPSSRGPSRGPSRSAPEPPRERHGR